MFILLLFAFVGALGVYSIYLSLTWKPSQNLTDDIAAIQGMTPVDDQKKKHRWGAIETWLSRSQLNVPISQFLISSVAWAAGGAVLLWFTTGGYTIVPILGAVIGVLLYTRWLIARRDDRLIRYEEAIADLADRLAIAAANKGSLEETLKAAVSILPEIIRPDIQAVVDQIDQSIPVLEALDDLRKRRRFVMMEILVRSLVEWRTRSAGQIPLAEILQPLSDSLRRIAFNRQQETDKLGRARNTARMAAVAPAVLVLLFRLLNPTLSRFFETIDGELLISLSAIMALGIFLISERWLAQHRETIKFGS